MRFVPETHADRPDADASERAARRFRLARLAVALGIVERAVGAAASFVRIPLLLWGLGLHDYGLWVAILGIVNTLTVSIIDRRRELGVLQAVGGLRGQIRRTIWMEAIAITIIGAILGFALGGLNLYYVLEIARRDVGGMNLDYLYPVSIAIGLVPTLLAAAFVSAIGPGETAVRGSLVDALAYE